MAKQTYIVKGLHGWKAETHIDAPELGANRVITVNTGKRSNGMVSTSATVQKRDGAFMSFIMFQDLHRTLVAEALRCTSKTVEDQHTRALALMDGFMAEARLKYAPEEVAA